MPNPGSRQSNKILPTPKVADLLFSELVEASRFAPKGTAFPYEYGTTYAALHSNSTLFPNHKLVLVEDADKEGLWLAMWWAADRDDQDDYNWTVLYPYANNPNLWQLTREYVVPRDTYEPLALGTPDPGNPFADGPFTYLQPDESSFTYLQPAASTDGYNQPSSDPDSSGAILVAQSAQPLEYDSKISSLYIRVSQVYQKVPGADDVVPGSGESQTDTGYSVTRPFGTDSFFRLVWKLYLPREIADANHSPEYHPCPIPGYTNLLLVNEKIEASQENNQISTVTRTYEGNIEGAPFPSADRVYYQGMFFPSSMPPDKFVVSKRRVVTTNITQGSEEESVFTPAASPEQTAAPKYDALESVEAKPSESEPGTLGSKEVTYYTDIEIATLSGETWDNNLRDMVDYTSTVVPADEVPNLGDPEVGTQREITPLGTGWSLVTIQAPRETTIETLTEPFYVVGKPRSYLDSRNDHWPNVLYDLQTVFSPDGQQIALDYEFRPEEYNGPCIHCIQVAWSKTAPQLLTDTTLQAESFDPSPLRINWPGVVNEFIPACLHYNPDWELYDPQPAAGAYVFTGPNGTTYFKTWLPSSFHEWPESYVKEVRVEPYLGGWWLTKITVKQPDIGNA